VVGVRFRPGPFLVAALVLGASVLTGCGSDSPATHGGVIRVVAAENFWGSIAGQVGGSSVRVTSLIDNPSVDPHDYEPTPADARAVATADLVIVNGVGYDGWAQKLVSASSSGGTVLNVGKLVGAKNGDNPHRWYNPADVRTFVAALTRALARLDPGRATTFDSGQVTFEKVALKPFDDLVATIRTTYAGTRVGASESIFSMLAPSLGLNLITPAGFLKAISEGSDVSASDKATIDRQIATHQIAIYVYNSQNATPDIQAQIKACKAANIPTATLTETLSPASATFQQWQSAQLSGIAHALAQATGRS
jgi:zinc/manganese transport system substrate-binding protein